MSAQGPSVEEAVTEVIRKIVGKNKNFALTDSLTRDLRISSDDLSFFFVPELERRLGVKVPVLEWGAVHTGLDACALLRKHLLR